MTQTKRKSHKQKNKHTRKEIKTYMLFLMVSVVGDNLYMHYRNKAVKNLTLRNISILDTVLRHTIRRYDKK